MECIWNRVILNAGCAWFLMPLTVEQYLTADSAHISLRLLIN